MLFYFCGWRNAWLHTIDAMIESLYTDPADLTDKAWFKVQRLNALHKLQKTGASELLLLNGRITLLKTELQI